MNVDSRNSTEGLGWAGRVFPKHQQRVAQDLSPVIGEEAAQTRAQAGSLGLLASLLALIIVGVATLTKLFGGAVLLSITLLFCLGWIGIVVVVLPLGQRADRLARAYVSQQLGYDIGHITGSAAPFSWKRSIERARNRHEKGSIW